MALQKKGSRGLISFFFFRGFPSFFFFLFQVFKVASLPASRIQRVCTLDKDTPLARSHQISRVQLLFAAICSFVMEEPNVFFFQIHTPQKILVCVTTKGLVSWTEMRRINGNRRRLTDTRDCCDCPELVNDISRKEVDIVVVQMYSRVSNAFPAELV